MLWIMNILDKFFVFISRKVKPNVNVNYIEMFVVGGGIFSLVPLYIVGCYNHMSGDDWYNVRLLHQEIENNTFSIIGMLKIMINDLIELYTRWSFTYGGFITYFMPAGFGEGYQWLHTVILLTMTVLCMYFALNRICYYWFKTEKWESRVCSVILIIIMTQYMPSAFDGFYWWSGSISNTMGFSISIVVLSFLFALHNKKRVGVGGWILLTILLFLGAGSCYASVLVLFCCMILMQVDILMDKGYSKCTKIAYTSNMVWFCACILFAITAPGNARRSQYIETGMTPMNAILEAYSEGIWLIYDNLNVPTILLLLIICIILLPQLMVRGSQFKYPFVFCIITYSIYITSFIPTLYAMGFPGDLRVKNIQYWYSILFILANMLYFCGWYVKKKNICSEVKWWGNFKKDILVCALAICAILMLNGDREPASKIAVKGLLMGEVQQFDKELDEREKTYNACKNQEVIVEKLSVIPEIFEGYTDLDTETYWIHDNIKEYYGLKRLRASENGEIVQ